MTLGTKFKRRMDRVFNNRNIRSTAIFTPITKAIGSYGGYEAPTETEGAVITVRCIPSDFFKTKFFELDVGNMDTGDVQLVIKGDETVTKEYTVEWKDVNYSVEDIEKRVLANTVVAQVVSLSKIPITTA